MTITPEEIARLRALEARATPSPWYAPNEDCHNHADFDLVPAARNALPRLLDEIERLRDELDFQQRLRVPCECSADDACKFARERDEARAEVLRLQQHRTKLDCRFVGQYGDSDARHCLDSESPKPCQRCTLEMANESLRADLREAMELLRWASPDMGHASWDEWGGRANLLLAKHKETP